MAPQDLENWIVRLQDRILIIETDYKQLVDNLGTLTGNLAVLNTKIANDINLVGKYEALNKKVIDLEKKNQELFKPVERVEVKPLKVNKSFWDRIRK